MDAVWCCECRQNLGRVDVTKNAGDGQIQMRSASAVPAARMVSFHQVVQYIGYVNCVDYQRGHGTHVAGSVAGAMTDSSAGEHYGDGVS